MSTPNPEPIDDVAGGTGRNASTLELFFDLVYVFAITQVVGAIHNNVSFVGLAQGALLLMLLWWTWSVYTWTTNWTGTDGFTIRMLLLAAMGGTLFMAIAVPDAFSDKAVWFGAAYLAVRVLATALYWVASKPYPNQRAAFITFFPVSSLATLSVFIGAFLGSPWLWVLWTAGAALDVVSAISAGKGTWAIDAKHFAERMGLFIIIALGESVVGMGITAAGLPRDAAHTAAIIVTFVTVAALWWSYFDKAAPHAERYFTSVHGKERGRFARDAYSILHYPLVVGIVYFGVTAGDVLSHPTDPLDTATRWAMVVGMSLVLLAMAAVTRRTHTPIGPARVVASGALVVLGVAGGALPAMAFTGVATAILIATLAWEHTKVWPSLTV